MVSTFLGWLTGRPSERQRPTWWRWTLRSLGASLMAYVFLYGPGVRVWSSPPGFDTLRDGTVTVHYQPGMEAEAAAVAASVEEAERAILAFWDRTDGPGFDFPVDVYLCRNPRRYWHLVMNRAKASAAGNDLMIHATYPEEERTRFLCHELAHLYVVHELGWLRSRLHTPAWLDEGIATSLQGSPWNDRDGLARFTSRTGELATLSSSRTTLRWLAAVTGGGDRAGAQYAYARSFTEDLIDRFGRRSVLDFLTGTTLSGDHSGTFARSFGLSLEQAEQQWLTGATRDGVLPADLELVDRGLPTGLLARLLVLVIIVAFTAMWAVRQVGLAVRAALQWHARRSATPTEDTPR